MDGWPAGGKPGQVLTIDADGRACWADPMTLDARAEQWVHDWKDGYASILYFTDASDAAKDAFKAGVAYGRRNPTDG